MNYDKWVSAHVRELVPYQSARRIGGHGQVFLNANESPDSERYLLNSKQLNRYPECQPPELLDAYAAYAGVSPAQVLASRGSDEAIGLLIRACIDPRDDEAVMIVPPTYGMYEVAARSNRANVVIAAREDGFKLRAASLIKAAREARTPVKLIFIDSPANPLGTLLEHGELRTLLAALPDTLIVVDEAYIEFAPGDASCVPLLQEHDNLAVTRTLSKAFALAGIRCGFTLGRPELIAALLKIIDPYPISDPVAQIALQALARGGQELMQARVSKARTRRAALEEHLKGLGIVREIFSSQGNFVLARFTDGDAVFAELVKRGIIVRSFTNRPGLENCLRISVGNDTEMHTLCEALDALS